MQATIAKRSAIGATAPHSGRRGLLSWLQLFAISSVVLGAIAPLRTLIAGIPLYTPYVPLTAFTLIAAITWLIRPRSILKRAEERVFLTVQLAMVVTSMFSVSPYMAFGQSMQAVYAGFLYVGVRASLKNNMLRRRDFLILAGMAFVVLTATAATQLLVRRNVGVVATYFGQNLDQGASWHYVLRVSATFVSANVFAQVYGMYGTLLSAACLFSEPKPRTACAMAISVVTIILGAASLSRGGMLFTLLAQAVLYAYWATRVERRLLRVIAVGVPILALVGIVVAYALLASSPIAQALARFQMLNGSDRMALMRAAITLLSHPSVVLVGVGSGQFFVGLAHFGIPVNYEMWQADITAIHASVHNWILQVASENGIPILFLYGYSITATLTRGWKLRRHPSGWLAASTALIIASLYVTALQLDTSGVTPWILTPVAMGLAWIQHEYDRLSPTFSTGTRR